MSEGSQRSLFELQAQYERQRANDARKADAVEQWLHEVSGPGWYWYIKILSGNDTLLNEAHQAGPYLAKRYVFQLFPSFGSHLQDNIAATIPVRIDSHSMEHELNVRWYGRKKREAHVTGWGGRRSPILDPEATGSILILAFHQPEGHDADGCRAWLCSSVDEEEVVQERVGPIEPGELTFFDAGAGATLTAPVIPVDSPCTLREGELPPEWLLEFPRAADVVANVVARLPTVRAQAPDDRLLRRRHCEYELFRSIEQVVVLPRIREGFRTVDLFVDYANSVTNRRKSRSGASLGLQTGCVFDEEGLAHSYDQVSEGKKRPDFLFPSAEAYRAATSPDGVAMLAAKTTCKDRWRQILTEADKLPTKYLLTLQEGVSLNQHAEMQAEGVVLVVPSRLHAAFHEKIVPHLLSLTQFIEQTRAQCGG